MGIDGKLIMPEISTSTLNCELFQLIDNLKNPQINENVFQMEKKLEF